MAMILCFMRLFKSRSDLCSQKAPKSLRLATPSAIFFIHQSSHTLDSLNTTGVQSTALIKQGLGGISSQLHSLCFASYLIWRNSCFSSLMYAHFFIWFLVLTELIEMSYPQLYLCKKTLTLSTYSFITKMTSMFLLLAVMVKYLMPAGNGNQAFIHVFLISH